ncbi:response regulator transcription factor [Methylobacterium sp. 10]|uniref:response regulator transcription factor n=1 Tax=Methylobacterium sp. 10 TaxID=1101191 RepID=UPI0004850D1E|nr:response regulator transcription factor [Methylobacterium sp. 10]
MAGSRIVGDVTILLVDDHPVAREGYARLLERRPGYRVVAEGGDADDAYRLYRLHTPTLAIMDLALPGASGIAATRHIRQWDRRARIVIVTMRQGTAMAIKAFEAGAAGYVSKSAPPREFLAAVETVLGGGRAMSDDIRRGLAEERLQEAPSPLDELGPREAEILRLMALGSTVASIADILCLSRKTVQNNLSLIKAKLGAETDAHLVWIAARTGLVQREDEAGAGWM